MGIFDGITEERRHGGRRCTVAVICEQLEAEDRIALVEVLRNTSVPASSIRDRLVSAGYEISKDTLNNHRRGDCRCPREATK